ncbi:MAG TPA: hypothetical protein VFR78_21120 [Pyrinomonadaceae bacterium]|nr:hypothetical protein [Pyrinomonadaceae bacterium]
MRYEEKISGPHDRRVHFGCGLFFGGILGVAVSMQLFETMPWFVVGIGVVALIIAYCCARWGDPMWYWLIRRLDWFH